LGRFDAGRAGACECDFCDFPSNGSRHHKGRHGSKSRDVSPVRFRQAGRHSVALRAGSRLLSQTLACARQLAYQVATAIPMPTTTAVSAAGTHICAVSRSSFVIDSPTHCPDAHTPGTQGGTLRLAAAPKQREAASPKDQYMHFEVTRNRKTAALQELSARACRTSKRAGYAIGMNAGCGAVLSSKGLS
jgi:hypothetical protein